jgi:hypothetical protein
MPHTAVMPVLYNSPDFIGEPPHEVNLPVVPWVVPHRQNASSPVIPPPEPATPPLKSTAWADESDHKYDVDDGFITPKRTCKPPQRSIETEELNSTNSYAELAHVDAAQDQPTSSHQSAAFSSSSQAPEEPKPKRKPASRTRKAKPASQPSE